MYQRIFLIEPACCGLEHVPVNSGMLKVLRTAFPDAALEFWAEPGHLKHIVDSVEEGEILEVAFREIRVPDRHERSIRRRKSVENEFFMELRRRCSGEKSLVVFLSTPASALLNARLSFGNRNDVDVHCVLHGGAGQLAHWTSRNPFVRITNDRFLFPVLTARNFRYVLLEQSILKEIRDCCPKIAAQAFVIEHPLPPIKSSTMRRGPQFPIRIAFLGFADQAKGFNEFCEFAKCVRRISPEEIEFHAIGSWGKNAKPEGIDTSALITPPSATGIPLNKYHHLISEIDLVALPYSVTHYTTSPSGTLLDAIALRKPVLSTPFGIARQLFTQYGDLGILANISEWQQRLLCFSNETQRNEYYGWCDNMEQVALNRSVYHLSEQYRANA
jgi:hypothetical protein